MGPPWVDEWEDMYTCILLVETEEMRSNDDRRHNTCISNKVLLKCDVKLPWQQMASTYLAVVVGGTMVERAVLRGSGAVGACSEGRIPLVQGAILNTVTEEYRCHTQQ